MKTVSSCSQSPGSISFRTKRSLLVLALVFAVVGPQASAETINVPADQPTIQDAVNNAAPGDEIVLADGTYDESIDLDQMGSAFDPATPGDITIRAANDLMATINGGDTAAILATSFDGDLTVSGLILTANPGIAGGVFNLNGVNGVVTIVGNEWPANYGGNGLRITALGDITTTVEVRDNTFTAPADNRDAIYLETGGSNGLDFSIIDNSFSQLEDDGIKLDLGLSGSPVVLGRIFGNTFDMPAASGSPVDLDFGSSLSLGVYASVAIENNQITGTISSPAIRIDVEGEGTLANVIVRNNTITNPDGEGIFIDSGSSAMAAIGNILIDGNTITGSSPDAAIRARAQGTDPAADGLWHFTLNNNTLNWTGGDGMVFDASSLDQFFRLYLELSDNQVLGTQGGASAYVFAQLLGDVFLETGVSESDDVATILSDNNNAGAPDSVSVAGLVVPGPDAVPDGWVPANLGDFIWSDTNGDGIQDGEEDGIPGVHMDLSGTLNINAGAVALATISDSTGGYLFPAMLPAEYTLAITPPEASDGLTLQAQGDDPTIDSDFDPATNDKEVSFSVDDVDVDAGLLPFDVVTVSGAVFEDRVADGLATGDPALPGITIERWRDGGDGEADFGVDGDDSLAAIATTSAMGTFEFSGVGGGLFFFRAAALAGSVQTTSPAVISVTTSSGEDVADLVFGFAFLGSIHGLKFEDIDENGVWDSMTEPGLAGITFSLTGTDGLGNVYSLTTTSDSAGSFGFTGLVPSATGYTVTETVPAGSIATTPTSYQSPLSSRQELVALAGQAGLPVDDPRVEVVVGAGLQFGNIQGVDIEITKTESIDPVVAGSGPGNLTYVVAVTNNGPRDATGIIVAEAMTLPSGVTEDSVTASPGTSYNAGTWTVGSLTNGASATLTVTLTVAASAAPGTDVISNTATLAAVNEPELNDTNDSATESTSVVAEVDIELTKTESIDPVVAGSGEGNLVYVVTATNSGPSDARAVAVSESLTLPAGVSVDSIVPSGTTTYSEPTWTIATLASGASETLTITLTVAPNASPGTDVISDTATVTDAEGTDTDPTNNSATEATSISAEVDLSISKTESADPVVAGSSTGNLTYVVTATNNGPTDAAGVTVSETLTLPAGVSIDSVTPSDGTFSDPTWTIGTLAAGASETLTVVLTVSASASAGADTISNTATVSAVDGTETNPGDDSATESTSVTREVDLVLEKTGPPYPVAQGETLIYDLSVTNLGPSDASGVTVTDTLPPEVTFVSTTGCAEDPSGVPSCTLGTIAAGNTLGYTLYVTVNPDPPQLITNQASVTSTEPELDSVDNTDEAVTSFDETPPTVTGLSSGSPGSPSLGECSTVSTVVRRLSVTFSEAMRDPPGDDQDDDITNGANYRVVGAGPDGDFSTFYCGPVMGDDLEIPIGAVNYDQDSQTSTLETQTLPASQIRVIVCGSTSVKDVAGNPLDGTGDGVAGDDFVVTFRSDPGNLFANGHFDCPDNGIDDWTTVGPTDFSHSDEDVDGSSISGSVGFSNFAARILFGVAQCVTLTSTQDHHLDSRLLLESAGTHAFWKGCEFYTGELCGEVDTGIATTSFDEEIGDTAGAWHTSSEIISVPPDAQSARCGVYVGSWVERAFTANFDDLSFTVEGTVFSDGFESGDTTMWSTTQP